MQVVVLMTEKSASPKTFTLPRYLLDTVETVQGEVQADEGNQEMVI